MTNLSSVFREVETISNDKIDTAMESIEAQRIVPSSMNLAGIDPTQGGKRLTCNQRRKYDTIVMNLYNQREALKVAFAEMDIMIMPYKLFSETARNLGLFVLETSKKNRYNVKDGWEERFINSDISPFELRIHSWITWLQTKTERTSEHAVYYSSRLSDVFGISAMIFIFSAFIQWAKWVGTLNGGFVYYASVVGLLAPIVFFVAYFIACIKYKDLLNRTGKYAPSLADFFPNRFLENKHIDYKKSYVEISLPQPPDKVLNKMVKVWEIHNKLGGTVFTIADEKAIGVSFTLVKPKPEPVVIRQPRREDPGLVVKYGDYAVILPGTFYNVTELEQSFLDTAVATAQSFNARAYIFN